MMTELHSAGGRVLGVEGDEGRKAKQPYGIAMKDGRSFGIGGIWENWKDPATGGGQNIRGDHRRCQRTGHRNSRSDAADPGAG
jgi:hypothetical protein